jgi:aminopeptidase N
MYPNPFAMKKFVFSLFLTVLFCLANSQSVNPIAEEFKCSRAAHFNSLFKGSKDIVQTPLLNNYDVKFYFLDLNVENDTAFISGNVTIKAEVVVSQLDTFAFELLDGMPIDSIHIDDIAHSWFRENNEVFVPLNSEIEEGNLFSAKIFYHGIPEIGEFFSNGVTTDYDSTWNKHVTRSQSEPFSARQWWPVKQVLTDKADSVWVFITTDTSCMAGSQGLLTDIVPLGDKHRFEWKSNYPIDYYLISFAVADYQEYNIYAHPEGLNGDSILIQNFIYDSPGYLENNKPNIDNTATFIELFSDLYSIYPFHAEKYGHCVVTHGGGMEHQTMTTLGGFSFGLVAHELGHMWFGDNITCATWSDIWINEGFATYSDYLAHEFIANPIYPPIWLSQAHNTVLSEPDGSVYVPPEEVTYNNEGRIFNSRLSYKKGALLLHMIRFELQDDDLFFQVFKNFQQQYAGGTATGIDFMNVLNETTGIDFTDFFDTWYFGEGYPIFNINWTQEDGLFEVSSVQQGSVPDITSFFKMHIPYKLFFDDGSDTTIRFFQTSNENLFSVPIVKNIDSIQIDPERRVLIKVESINGTEVVEANTPFKVFPNPVGDKMSVFVNGERGFEVSITDLSGKEVLKQKSKQPIIVLNVYSLQSGTYLVNIKTDKDRFSQKFIKN